MYLIRQRHRFGRQPEEALKIDWSNPLSKGLLDGLDWKYRRYLWDGRYMENTGTLTSPYYRQQTLLGQASALYASSNPLRPQMSGRFTAGSLTLLHVGVIASVASGAPSGTAGHTSGATGAIIWTGNGTTAGAVIGQVYTGTTQTVGGSVVLPVGDAYIGVLRSDRRRARQDFWLNGVPDPVTTASSGSPLNLAYFGNYNTSTNVPSLLTLIWDRALTDDEMMRVSRDPWEVVRPARRVWVPVSAAGGAVDVTPADALHAHAADVVALTSTTLLAPADALHAHAADFVALTLQVYLAVAEALHAHAAEEPATTETAAGTVTPADAMHGHSADTVALTLLVYLVVADALHAHAADAPAVSLPSSYTTLELIYRILANRQELNPADGTFTIYDDDGTTVLLSAQAWADADGTVPYSGNTLARIDRLV